MYSLERHIERVSAMYSLEPHIERVSASLQIQSICLLFPQTTSLTIYGKGNANICVCFWSLFLFLCSFAPEVPRVFRR